MHFNLRLNYGQVSNKRRILWCSTFERDVYSDINANVAALPHRHRTELERTSDVQKTSWTSSERLMYV